MKTYYFITYYVTNQFKVYIFGTREKYKKYYPVQSGHFVQNHKKIIGAKMKNHKNEIARVGANHTFNF
jgi:hypothetical protein